MRLVLINTDHGSFSREWDCGIDNLCKAEMYTTPSRRVIFFRSETRLDCELDAVGANAVAFGGVAAGSTRGARAGRRICSLVGCVSVDRATAVFGAISVNLQMLKKVEEISPKLEKSTQVTQILEDSLEPFEMASPAPTRRVTPIQCSVLPLATLIGVLTDVKACIHCRDDSAKHDKIFKKSSSNRTKNSATRPCCGERITRERHPRWRASDTTANRIQRHDNCKLTS